MRYIISIAAAAILMTGGCKKSATTPGQVKDIDGNVYNTVKIGTQTWMKENLRTTHFRDGSVIPEVSDNQTWVNNYNNNSFTPAWCYTNGDPTTDAAYGKLYNCYAIMDARLICPTGWHVPSNNEWNVLVQFSGDSLVAARHLMATGSMWMPADTVADNSSGFTGLPAGIRYIDAYYYSFNNICSFWSATPDGVGGFAYDYSLWNNRPDIVVSCASNQGFAVSLRCIKDE
jgi:uncharacterized protein (TIGR02145 family)